MSTPAPSSSPRCAYTQEVRFAIVMYGGVSLAIYINGIAQELYHLVRATAPADNKRPDDPLFSNDQLSGTERVYRKLGQIISNHEEIFQESLPDDPIRTRFVVDILSGTSAGGINAIFLAKALANNQLMNDLKQLWVEEGDLALLLNDKESVKNLPLTRQRQPQSLLNSNRMYLKLLKAFDDMEKSRASTPVAQSPYGTEVDLFVTATDIRGVTVPLRLADAVVYERRHKNVFHFKYYTTASQTEAQTDYVDRMTDDGESIRNDFMRDFNPFLAFAARCTSSFPFAFEPMRLDDIDGIVKRIPPYNDDPSSTSAGDRWARFIEGYRSSSGIPFRTRSFGDGGYLDNKPFSYAIDALMTRQADFPVDRKLIYIEPAPEHPEQSGVSTEKPDALENVNAALLVLPRYETIREDLQRVLQRNSLIERISRITTGIEVDVKYGNEGDRAESLPGPKWAEQDLAEMIRKKGIAYGGYQRLKVGSVTDQIAELIARASGLDEDSDQLLGIRYLVRAWRSMHYTIYKERKETRATENRFLLEFDLGYRMRRLAFVQGKLDVLHGGGRDAEAVLDNIGRKYDLKDLNETAFRQELLNIRASLASAYSVLNGARNALRARQEKNPLHHCVVGTGITPDQIKKLLNEPTENFRMNEAKHLLQQKSLEKGLTTLAGELSSFIFKATGKASEICSQALNPKKPTFSANSPERRARECLWHYYQFYDDYDMITFPVLYSADAGELDVVEVIRISPEDATSLINEREESAKPNGRKKLAGTALGNFGAFLDRVWRENDILWGRLDGAERIISSLLPGDVHKELRDKLIQEAQEEILKEDLRPQDVRTLSKVLAESLVQSKGIDDVEKLRELVEKQYGDSVNSKAEALFRLLLKEESLLQFFRESYSVNRTANPEATLKTMSRASRIIGKMLEQLSEKRNLSKSGGSWVARLGQVFWGLVIVAVPGSLVNLLVRHWLKVLYVFEALLIVSGTLLTNTPMQQLGITLAAITLGMNFLIFLISDFIKGRKFWLRLLVTLLVSAFILLAALGADALFGHPVMNWLMEKYDTLADWLRG